MLEERRCYWQNDAGEHLHFYKPTKTNKNRQKPTKTTIFVHYEGTTRRNKQQDDAGGTA